MIRDIHRQNSVYSPIYQNRFVIIFTDDVGTREDPESVDVPQGEALGNFGRRRHDLYVASAFSLTNY